MSFNEIKIEDFNNAFDMISKQWMLVTASNGDKVNTMTASWGGIGIMWGKPVAFVFIRPQRYTKEFIDSSKEFSLSFYGEEYRKMLSYMGSTSGRDEDKIKEQNLTINYENNVPYFNEAETALIVRKMYAQYMNSESFIDKEAEEKWYPNKDYHMMYVCEIEKVLKKQ